MPLPPASTLRGGLGVMAHGIREQPRWFALAVTGSTVYGIATGLMAWVIGLLTRGIVAPAVTAGSVTPAQLRCV